MSTTDYSGFRGAGVRLTQEQLPHLSSHRTELLGDSLLAIHAFDKAHLVMLIEQELIPREDGRQMLAAFQDMEARGVAETRMVAQGGMHSGEQYLIRELGPDIGGRLHMGRSSGDLIEVARRMTFRVHLTDLLEGLCEARTALLDLARRHVETVMPAYTHGQHAQPTTFAHWATMFEQAFARDATRAQEVHARVNLSPAGAAILTGTDFAIDRDRVAELLGFDAVIPHTWDAIMSHDLEMEIGGLYATCAATVARLADDLYLWSTSEFAFVELADRFCGTSSIMPQKKNPDALEDIKSVATQALAAQVAVVNAERGPTGFPILERRHSQAVLWSVGSALGRKLCDAADIVSDLHVDVKRMEDSAGSHWAQVTDLASALTRETGLDWRSAHQAVAHFVRQAIEQGRNPATVTLDLLEQAIEAVAGTAETFRALPEQVFRDALDARAFVNRRNLLGGPAPQAVLREITAFETRLADDREHLVTLRAGMSSAEKRLEDAVSLIVG